MKKYYFKTARTQWEKMTEPKYVFNAKAQVIVLAEDEAQARKLAAAKLQERFQGTGTVLLDELELTAVYDLPVDWSYGYGDARRSGPTESIGDKVGNSVIR